MNYKTKKLPKTKKCIFILSFEPDNVHVGRLVAPGNSEGLMEGLLLVVGTSTLFSVTAGSLLMVHVHCISISHREVVVTILVCICTIQLYETPRKYNKNGE